MFFRSKKDVLINTNDILEQNLFAIKKSNIKNNYTIIDGICIKGFFNIKDKIVIRENTYDITEGYILKIINYKNQEIENTNLSKNKEFIFYLILDDDIKINKNNIITKN